MFLLPNANGDDPMAPARLIQVRLAFCEGRRWGRFYEVRDFGSPVLDMLNVRFLISRHPLDSQQLARGALVLRGEFPGFLVYERLNALPRFWLVSRVRAVRNMDEASSVLRSPGFRPAEEAIVEGWSSPSQLQPGPPGSVRVLHYDSHTVELEVDAPGPRYLVTSETHYPGQRAYLDGVETPLYYTNVAFRGMPVPAGRHRIRMEFHPDSLRLGAAISLTAWLGWTCLLLFHRRISRPLRTSPALPRPS
jgi:hypothetical protein